MNITINKNYLKITDIDDFSSAVEKCAEKINDDIFAAVFCINDNTEVTEEIRNLLLGLPVISAVYSEKVSSMSSELLMSFDLRFSEDIYSVKTENAASLAADRFGILFGDARKAALEECIKTGNDEDIVLDYFSITGESFDEYFSRIFREKSDVQNKALTECIVSLRTGCTQNGFEKESVNFYRLIKEITKE